MCGPTQLQRVWVMSSTTGRATESVLSGGLVSHTPAGVNIDLDEFLRLFEARRISKHDGPHGIVVADALQDDLPLVAVSRGFTALTGYREAEILGRNCRFLQGEHTDPRAVTFIRRGLDSSRPVVVTLLNYRKDGTPFWNRLAINPIRDEGGQVLFFAGVSTDVTSLRDAEQQLSATVDEIQQAFRGHVSDDAGPIARRIEMMDHLAENREGELRDILATLTHELRRPTLSISGLMKIYRQEVDGDLPEEHRKTLDLVQAEAERMKRLVNRLGEMVIVEETPVLPHREMLSEIIQAALDYHEPLRAEHGVTVDNQCADDGKVFVSRFQLYEGVSNLIKNAYIHGSGNAEPRLRIECDNGPGLVRLRFIDNGDGIPEKAQDRIFGLFARADPTGERPGDGIGLAVVRRLMSRIGGTVALKSTPGEGATFTLTFPAEPA